MKTKLAIALLAGIAASAGAQDIKLDWFTIDGGGGTSSGGAYTLSGTLGQFDAATSYRGAMELQGGFWPAFATGMQTNGLNLRIARTPVGDVLVAWSVQYPGYVLEGASELPTANWFQFPMAPVINGTEYTMFIPVNQSQRYLRLRRP